MTIFVFFTRQTNFKSKYDALVYCSFIVTRNPSERVFSHPHASSPLCTSPHTRQSRQEIIPCQRTPE